nr:MAG TPA: hypothetical protein [Caudoviricetes sp.]
MTISRYQSTEAVTAKYGASPRQIWSMYYNANQHNEL